MHILVVDLNPDNRPAILIKESFHLLADMVIEPSCIVQKTLAQLPYLERLAVQPVRQTAVANLAVGEGADPQDDIEIQKT